MTIKLLSAWSFLATKVIFLGLNDSFMMRLSHVDVSLVVTNYHPNVKMWDSCP